MRYKLDLAEFLPITDAARLIHERAKLSEDEAKADIVLVLRDGAASFRFWRLGRDGRSWCHRGDLPHGFLDNLTAKDIDWETSIARRRSVYVPFAVEIEVSRSSLDRLWPDSTPAAPSLTDASRAKGGKAAKYDSGLQQFIDHLFIKFKKKGAPLTYSDLKTWLEAKAPFETGYQPEPHIPDCDDIEFYDGKVWWKDRSGQQKSVTIRSLERYIQRAREPASTKPA